jgi:hypothetical protein
MSCGCGRTDSRWRDYRWPTTLPSMRCWSAWTVEVVLTRRSRRWPLIGVHPGGDSARHLRGVSLLTAFGLAAEIGE